MSHYFENLVINISSLSTIKTGEIKTLMKNWEKTCLEWKYIKSWESENHCICEHEIKYNYEIENKFTKERTIVGSKCIKQFKNDELKTTVEERHKIMTKLNKIMNKKLYTVDVIYKRPFQNDKALYEIKNTIEGEKIYDIFNKNDVDKNYQFWGFNGKYYIKHNDHNRKKISFQIDDLNRLTFKKYKT